MTTKQAIKYFKLILEQKIVEREDVEPLRVLINAVENSVNRNKIKKEIKEYKEKFLTYYDEDRRWCDREVIDTIEEIEIRILGEKYE